MQILTGFLYKAEDILSITTTLFTTLFSHEKNPLLWEPGKTLWQKSVLCTSSTVEPEQQVVHFIT